MSYVPRLKEEYNSKIIPSLKEEFGYKNVMQVPKLEKIVLSRGVGAAVSDKKLVDYAVDELTKITGQKSVSTISKKDVASCKTALGAVKRILKDGRPTAFGHILLGQDGDRKSTRLNSSHRNTSRMPSSA